MKVIRINAIYAKSSTGRTALQLDEGLKKHGIESKTACPAGLGGEGTIAIGSPADVRIHSLEARLFGDPGYHSRPATRRFLRRLEEERPDIVHLHNLHGNFIDLPMLFGWLSENRVPTVVTLHDCWWFTGRCCHYTVDGCFGWEKACGSCPRLKKDIPSWFFDRSSRMLADKEKWFGSLDKLAVIGVSDWITGEAKRSILKNADIIERVYNWVDTDVFRPTQSDIRKEYGLEGKFILLGVSYGWTAAKGLNELKALSEALPEDMRLVLIGGLPAGYDAGEIINVPVTDDQRRLAEWYSAADACISLSPEESFGKVSAEALSCGTPIIVLDSTASPELAGEGCGEVIEDASPKTVMTAVSRIRRKGAGNYRAGCREFAERNFEMESNIARICDIYRRLTGGDRGN